MVINLSRFGLSLSHFERRVQSNRGFTLIELLIVVAVIGALATISMNAFQTIREKANVAKCSEEIRGLEKEITAYATDTGFLPTGLDKIGRQNLLDPWGRPYVYSLILHRRHPGLTNSDFDLYSKGFDGGTADSIFAPVSEDDIIRADDGSYCGLAGRYVL